MRKILKRMTVAAMAVSMICAQAVSVFAAQATSFTYTTDDDNELVRTQDAYLPDRTVTNLELNAPNDIAIDSNNRMFIADTGNKQIVVYDIKEGKKIEELTIKNDEFSSPKGLCITSDERLYIADSGANAIFEYDENLNFVKKYEKPKAPTFGKNTTFDPCRISVNSAGTMFVVCETNNTGIVQLSSEGEFLGYFTSNKTVLSLTQRFLKMIYTKEQEENSELLNVSPNTFSSVCIDDKQTIYTTCMSGTGQHRTDLVKKHRTDGTNIFAEGVYSTPNLTDVDVDKDGIIYATDTAGYIFIYTSTGELIFQMGASSTFGTKGQFDIAGLFSELVSIAVDNDGNIWTVDRDKGYLQSFIQTEYSNTIYRALKLYNAGEYADSLNQWSKVLRLNQMSVLAHNGIGKAYYHDKQFEDAMKDFEIAGNRQDYSNAFWEVRAKYVADNLHIAAIFIAILIVLRIAWAIGNRHKYLSKKKRAIAKKLKKTPVIGELGYAFRTARHPIDRYYDIRVGKNGSVVAATIIYIIFFITYMIYQTSKGFIYQFTSIEDMDISAVVVGFFAILILFIVCNFLVTSINDGDGTLRQVYLIPAYGLVPAWISMIFVIIFSYFLTYNESFLLTVALIVGVGWTLVNIFQGLSTVHDYEIGETFVSLIITFVFMLIAAVVVVIVLIMWDQLADFLVTTGKEIIRNVTE